MKNSLKIIVNGALVFSLIGFVTYLFFIVAGFFGCCLGITTSIYGQLIVVILVAAVLTFGFCMNYSCYMNIRQKT
jgi:hypothetical protein